MTYLLVWAVVWLPQDVGRTLEASQQGALGAQHGHRPTRHVWLHHVHRLRGRDQVTLHAANINSIELYA
jgi:hypothetical protein